MVSFIQNRLSKTMVFSYPKRNAFSNHIQDTGGRKLPCLRSNHGHIHAILLLEKYSVPVTQKNSLTYNIIKKSNSFCA